MQLYAIRRRSFWRHPAALEAVSPEALREHAARVEMPADEIVAVAATVVVHPDPVVPPA